MKVVGVEFNTAGKIFDFTNPKNLELKRGDKVVVETQRGKELAFVVEPAKLVEENNFDYKPILYIAKEKDIEKYNNNLKRAEEDFDSVQKLIYSCGLNNKLNQLEFMLDDSKIVVSFVSEERVDFRDLIKKLTEKYKMKIEIKLIGSRDEIKTKGAVGPCGRVCCCSSHLRNFDKISIKMAKNQNLSLAPGKISGFCGKLMCCLAYENDTYTELSKTMPKINSVVKTPKGEGLVVYNDLFKQRCTVKIAIEENKFETIEFGVEEIEFTKNK